MAENEKIDVAAALTKKLSEKPQALEHLLNIIDRLDTLDEFSTMLQAQREGATDAIVQRVADNITVGLSMLDSFSGEEQLSMIKTVGEKSESMKKGIEKIDELERSGTLQTLKEMGDFVAGFNKGTTDAMIERMAGTAEKLAELTELTLQYNIKPLLDAGQGLIDSGTLDTLVELANAATGARRMFTDGLIDRIVNTGQVMIEALVTQMDVKEVIKSINRSTTETINEAKEEKYQKGGVLSLLSLAKDPEVMHGLKFMMLLSKNLTIDIKMHAQDIFISNAGAEKEFKAI
ncbi:MAG: helical membrane plugin domain-containing protein [bacterium]